MCVSVCLCFFYARWNGYVCVWICVFVCVCMYICARVCVRVGVCIFVQPDQYPFVGSPDLKHGLNS